MNNKKTDIKKLILSKINSILIIEQMNFNDINEIIDKTANKLNNGTKLIELYPDLNNDRATYELSKKLRQLTSIYDSYFLIKNRFDIAKLIDSDGIILDFNSLELPLAYKLISEDKIFAYEAFKEEKIQTIDSNFDFIQINSDNIKTDKILFTNKQIERLK